VVGFTSHFLFYGVVMIIDTHCHLDFERFDVDRDDVVARAVEAGVKQIIVPALDLQNSRTILQLADRYEGVYTAVGIHPNATAAWQDNWIGILRDLSVQPKVVAVGEIGLDYYWDRSPAPVQQQAFALQLSLAAELNLPVIIHNRDASEDVVQMLQDSPLNGRDNPGVLHSFSADWQIAQRVLAMGFYLGFTGPITYKKADELREIAAKAPLYRILVETDAPFLSPQIGRKRPSRNEPAFVTHVVERIATVRGMAPAEIAQATTENARRLFSRMA